MAVDEKTVRRIVREEIAAHVAESHERQIKVRLDGIKNLAKILSRSMHDTSQEAQEQS